MDTTTEHRFQTALNHLYISPLEKCNLHCRMCYTKKTDAILSEDEILEFIRTYEKAHTLETVTFCGGEVMALPYFPSLVNRLTKKGVIVQSITNGTIDRLDELKRPDLVNMIVSIDGVKSYHDKNRGNGMFKISTDFLLKAKKNGFHTEIFSIVTNQNFPKIKTFESKMAKIMGQPVSITYHPRKPLSYLTNHPTANIQGEITGFDFLTPAQMEWLFGHKKTFPPVDLGCFQISLMSDGAIYGCCEGTVPIGKLGDDIPVIFSRLRARLDGQKHTCSDQNCEGCAYPDFVCGMREYVHQ
jgi:organic radical activating enzyme